ncbi:MAG: lytic murein transglycosylase B, partial [Xanthomonas perforans]|nr:lytic murein transglycosylase B [Xanthomonas perforans]
MIRRSLACLLTLGLVACATQPTSPPTSPQASSMPRHPAGKP